MDSSLSLFYWCSRPIIVGYIVGQGHTNFTVRSFSKNRTFTHWKHSAINIRIKINKNPEYILYSRNGLSVSQLCSFAFVLHVFY